MGLTLVGAIELTRVGAIVLTLVGAMPSKAFGAKAPDGLLTGGPVTAQNRETGPPTVEPNDDKCDKRMNPVHDEKILDQVGNAKLSTRCVHR